MMEMVSSKSSADLSSVPTNISPAEPSRNALIDLCHEPCGEAEGMLQSLGKAVDLCIEPQFRRTYEACRACVSQGEPGYDTTGLLGGLSQFSAFCDDTYPDDIITETWTMTNGEKVTYTYTLDQTPPTRYAQSTINTPSTLPTKQVFGRENDSDDKAWIAGPVIGSAVVFSTLIGLFVFFRQRAKKPAPSVEEPNNFEKAQLHSDSIPWPCIQQADSQAIHEMSELRLEIDESYVKPSRAEKPANEPAAQELPA
ncbi:hypothetical protein B0I35DRAFT_444325 [Stachybotrys elegans]|uniref:Uncharacterized protein n=1 Tax=Stachybotrys elegans TaxID=80388 RepID=A0A8K0SFW1_9HYPO|nr:hypothetical protein B0I35DRAFT_444325 [Stachybotrys elegans]